MSTKYKDRTWLYEQYWDKRRNITAIALDCAVSNTTIHYWMRKFNIRIRLTHSIFEQLSVEEIAELALHTLKKYNKKHFDPNWLREEYLVKGRTASSLADECGVGTAAIYHQLKNNGIWKGY